MLRPPYSKYSRLFFYILDLSEVPEICDPDFIGAWPEADTIMLFFHREKQHYVNEMCRRYSCAIVYQADMDYNDWENGGEISSFSVNGLTVAPAWSHDPAQILLDPSVIFGNGFHPTTRLCLESLVELLSAEQISFSTALDLGCGTGLLAIATAKMGTSHVKAIDFNDLACQVARANIARNKLENNIKVEQLDLAEDCPSTNVDLLVANLHHTLLIDLFKDPEFWQAKYYIISGFFTHQEELLLAELPGEKVWFRHQQRRQKWGVWVLEKR